MKTLSYMYPGKIRKSVKSSIFLCKFKAAKVAVVVDILFELPKSLETLLNVYKDFSLQASWITVLCPRKIGEFVLKICLPPQNYWTLKSISKIKSLVILKLWIITKVYLEPLKHSL